MLENRDKYEKFSGGILSGTVRGKQLPSIFKADSSSIRKRSHPHLHRLDSSKNFEGNEVVREAKKNMSQASASSRGIVDRFMERVKSYHTFQPLISSYELHENQKDGDTRTKSNPWEMIDNLIEISTQHLVRHQADEHFFSTLGRVTGDFFRPSQKRRSPKVGFTHREDHPDTHSTSLEKKHRAYMDVWKRDHPSKSKEAFREESNFRLISFSEQEKKDRASYLRELQREIEDLSRLSAADNVSKSIHEAEKLTDKEEKDSACSDDRKKDQQKRCWTIFCKGEESIEKSTVFDEPPRIVHEYVKADELHHWIQSQWTDCTDRHENAALTIQKCFRCYQAKCILDAKLSAKFQLLRDILAAEEEGKQKWKSAIQEDSRREAKNSENTPEYRAINMVAKRILAIVETKRAVEKMKKQQETELQNYAATLIQKVFRGYYVRVQILLTPRTVASRLEAKKNAPAYLIQATWKRKLVLRRLESLRKAAITIQRCYRKFVARRTLTYLRGMYRIDLEDTEKQSAAHTLTAFGIKGLYGRKRSYKMHKESIDLLQRVGRGYLHRSFAFNIPWNRKKEAACQAIVSQWHDVLEVRRAKFSLRSFELRRERENWHLTQTDAALTIQNAWRNYIGLVKWRRNRAFVSEKEEVPIKEKEVKVNDGEHSNGKYFKAVGAMESQNRSISHREQQNSLVNLD